MLEVTGRLLEILTTKLREHGPKMEWIKIVLKNIPDGGTRREDRDSGKGLVIY